MPYAPPFKRLNRYHDVGACGSAPNHAAKQHWRVTVTVLHKGEGNNSLNRVVRMVSNGSGGSSKTTGFVAIGVRRKDGSSDASPQK